MTYFDFKQLLNDAALDSHMKVNLVDASFKKGIWNSVNDYIHHLDNVEQLNDRYRGRISYEPEFDARGRIARVYIVIHHPELNWKWRPTYIKRASR